jgi:hypothetical protein
MPKVQGRFSQRSRDRITIFYQLVSPYHRLQDDDDVTVPLLSAQEGGENEENFTGLPNPVVI